MDCRECERILQECMDRGFSQPADQAVLPHLQECGACRERFALAERVHRSGRFLSPPSVPQGFADRVTAAVLRDRRRRVAVQVVLRIAAAVLIGALGLWLTVTRWQAGREQARETPPLASSPSKPTGADEPPLSLAAQLNEAREATEGITQLAKDTARGARLLLPPADRLTPEPLAPIQVESPALTVGEVSRTVAEGFEPVTDSARRAWGMFRRMIPAGEEKKKS